MHLKGEWDVAVSETLYPSLYQNVTEGKFTFIDERENPEEKKRFNRCKSNLDCIQILLI